MGKSLRRETQSALGLQAGPHPCISYGPSDVGHFGVSYMSRAV